MTLALLPPSGADAGARNVRLLSVLRMLAIGGQLATVLFVHVALDVALPLAPMLGALAVLLALNLGIAQVAARRAIGDAALFATLIVDVACLTLQLYLAGGLANPFTALYLLQVVIAAVLLPSWASWALVALTAAAFAGLAASPFRLPADYGAVVPAPYALGAFISYALAASLLVLFVTRIQRNLAEREARLAALRQRAAEEEHVVRMGLLASGAAHELGTPLSSLAVMLGDWRRDPDVAAAPALLADVEAMAGEIARCKDILGQVLLAAGEVRGEMPRRTTLGEFVSLAIDGWRQTAPHVTVEIADDGAGATPIVADAPLAQTLVNLLENAADAGARAVTVTLAIDGDAITLSARDDGRGFAPGMLETIGTPYRSTKPRHGAGLGLFLASNVLRTLGGTVQARSESTGSTVTLRWPRAATAAEA